jgi:hypothetical protein
MKIRKDLNIINSPSQKISKMNGERKKKEYLKQPEGE